MNQVIAVSLLLGTMLVSENALAAGPAGPMGPGSAPAPAMAPAPKVTAPTPPVAPHVQVFEILPGQSPMNEAPTPQGGSTATPAPSEANTYAGTTSVNAGTLLATPQGGSTTTSAPSEAKDFLVNKPIVEHSDMNQASDPQAGNALTKIGNGSVVLSGPNAIDTYSGPTNVNGGTR